MLGVIIMQDITLARAEQITKLLQDAMDIGIMFIICILVAACFIYYLWRIKPKLEEHKNLIISNNQKIIDGISKAETLVVNATQSMTKLNTTIESLNTSLIINNDKITTINAEIRFLKQDIEQMKNHVSELKHKMNTHM